MDLPETTAAALDAENAPLAQQLKAIETTEQDMNSSLQKQLKHVRETTASLQATTSSAKDKEKIQEALTLRDPDQLQAALQAALEKQKQQEALIKKLRHECDVERGHAAILRHDNQVLRQMKASMHAVAEQEEENISNKLLKRISGLKKEKGELMLQVEQEEEYLTNTLQMKLNQLQKEKIDMENALEQEQEYIVNRLQKQLDVMRMEQSTSTSAASSWHEKDNLNPGSSMPSGSSPINIAGGGRSTRINANPSPTPSPTHKKWIPTHSPSSSDHAPSHPLVDMLKAEVAAAKAALYDVEREYMIKFKQCNRYKSEVLALRQELGLPIGSDLIMEESLPSALSSHLRSGGTPSRRNSSTSVSGSYSSRINVPATPANTPANPAPISSNHHFLYRNNSLNSNNSSNSNGSGSSALPMHGAGSSSFSFSPSAFAHHGQSQNNHSSQNPGSSNSALLSPSSVMSTPSSTSSLSQQHHQQKQSQHYRSGSQSSPGQPVVATPSFHLSNSTSPTLATFPGFNAPSAASSLYSSTSST